LKIILIKVAINMKFTAAETVPDFHRIPF